MNEDGTYLSVSLADGQAINHVKQMYHTFGLHIVVPCILCSTFHGQLMPMRTDVWLMYQLRL